MKSLIAKWYAVLHGLAQIPNRIYVFTVYVAMATGSGLANAQGLFTGWRGMINDLIGLLVLGAMLAGVGAVLYGLAMLVKKGMGRGDDVEWRQVYWPLAGGAMLTVLMYMVRGLVVESGASESDMGQTRSF